MGKAKKYSSEQIVNLLRQIEVAIANGKTHQAACREAGVTEQTYYRRRKEYGRADGVVCQGRDGWLAALGCIDI